MNGSVCRDLKKGSIAGRRSFRGFSCRRQAADGRRAGCGDVFFQFFESVSADSLDSGDVSSLPEGVGPSILNNGFSPGPTHIRKKNQLAEGCIVDVADTFQAGVVVL